MMTALAGTAISPDIAPSHAASAVEDAWNALYEANARPLYRYLVKLTLGNRSEAEDHLQETFLRAWNWMQDRPVNPSTLRPWLFTVARHIVIDAARFRRVRPAEIVIEDTSVIASTRNDIDQFVEADAIRGALGKLSPEHRNVLIELFYRERTLQEAAEVLGIPEGTVKSRAHYALRALRAATVAAERKPIRLSLRPSA